MTDDADSRRAIRELVESWAVWRDAGDWERLRTVWHEDGCMMATWFQGSADGFIEANRQGWARGVRILHFLGGSSIDVAGKRAVSQTKMTISQRAEVHGVVCDVVCTGRFYDFFERRDGRWGLVLRQPIYEKDRLDPVDPAATLALDARAARALSRGLPPPRLPPDPGRLRGQAGHAGARGARAGGAVRARRRAGCAADGARAFGWNGNAYRVQSLPASTAAYQDCSALIATRACSASGRAAQAASAFCAGP